MMAHPVEPVREVRSHLAELIDRVRAEPTIISRNGRQVAALVSVDLLWRYEQLEDAEANRIIDQRMASTEPGIPLEEVIRETVDRT